MSKSKRVDMWYSLQSDYCYFLIDRLLKLSAADADVVIRPVLGLVLRMPELTNDRPKIAQDYFATDSPRTAEFLGLSYAYPDPSPIEFVPGSFWIAADEQPRIERLFRLFVGATRAGKGLAFLDKVVRHLWDGSQPGWDESSFLYDGSAAIELDHDQLLEANSWSSVSDELRANHEAMLAAGHWGVPLMVYDGEPFYGQDRFDQLLWRMGIEL